MYGDVTYLIIYISISICLISASSESLVETSTNISSLNENVFSENCTFLDLRGYNLTTVEDSVWKTHENLETIDVSNNPVTVVGILTSKTIKEFKLTNGSVRWIPNGSFRGLSRIETIILNNNIHLTTLEVSSKSLKKLEAAYCSLSEVSFPHAESLKYLNLSHNRITKIEEGAFAFNLNLETLDLSNNDIESIYDYVFIKLANLKYLYISSNKISRIEWTVALKNIEYLNVNNNEIDSIDFLMLKNVLILNISSNKLTEIPEELGRLLPKLEILYVRSNPIRQIKRLKSNSLKELYINECKIRVISPKAFVESPMISTLDVSDNKLDNFMFVTSLKNTSKINLSDNPWNCVCNITIDFVVNCQPENLAFDEYCKLYDVKPHDAWFLEAANPVIWAPLIVALVILVVACVGCRYFKKMMSFRSNLEDAPVDLVRGMHQSLIVKENK